ncbi:hypothetical protein RINTHM_11510 [Richelia intracellularis HM01]|uniref:Uncharacterized protein n=1 Tax=Richelia intracellularis HH01 TaxID=1165094 RepID=M1X1M1_9NOST|nr:hypothetical protein RINTHM_11510 [Richelia intracellularis HM01]CCH68318.1 hypothetical protein RINTHH_21630 [Richelia intracellularis HH01]
MCPHFDYLDKQLPYAGITQSQVLRVCSQPDFTQTPLA